MALLSWSHASAVGVKAMDDQHGILMDTMNDLRLTLMNGSSQERVDVQLEQLIDFTRLHFQSEERLLEQQGYPSLLAHRAAHASLLLRVREAIDHAQRHKNAESVSLLSHLRSLYLEHFEEFDRAYGSWLNDHGIS